MADMGKGECPVDRERTIAFQDVLVDVSGGGEKEVKRGREWFDAAGVERKRVKGESLATIHYHLKR
jgi:hypothetical protein